MKILLGDTMQK